MNLNAAECDALAEPSLPHAAFVLYTKCYRRFMSYDTGLVFISSSRMIAELEYIPVLRSKDKPITFTRERLATLIKHLVRVELITQVKAGNLRQGIAATWHCLQATTDKKKAFISAKRHNTEITQVDNTADNTVNNPENKGLQQRDNTADKTEATPRHNTITGTTVIYIYKGLDLKPFENIVSIEHLKHLVDHRINKKSKPTQYALHLQVKRLSRSQEVGMTPEQLIDYTIEKNWIAVNIDYTKNDLKTIQGLNNAKPTKIYSNTDYKQQPKGADGLFNDPYGNVDQLIQKI